MTNNRPKGIKIDLNRLKPKTQQTEPKIIPPIQPKDDKE